VSPGGGSPANSSSSIKIKLRIHRRCAVHRIRLSVTGADVRKVRRVVFRTAHRRHIDKKKPFAKSFRVRSRRSRRALAVAFLRDGRHVVLLRRARACRARG
jgi:hypothetical protein